MSRLCSSRWLLSLGLLASSGLSACGSDEGLPQNCEQDFKCDIPDDPADRSCALRREDAFNPNQFAFTQDYLRWSCADVAGVTQADRGQEYCEYFAMVALPPVEAGEDAPETAILGRNLGPTYESGTTEERLELSFHQINELESRDDEVVGQCIFSTWNSDIAAPLAACSDENCSELLGVPMSREIFSMKFEVNSAEAARILVEDCLVEPPAGDLENPRDPLHNDFFRACMLNEEINGTAFRKSDTTVCAAVTRLAECGCSYDSLDGESLAEFISPDSRRGFPLGGWSAVDELPAGCEYVDEGEGSQTLVQCQLTGADVVAGAFDLKGSCMQKYGDKVVVHVPMPAAPRVSCSPEQSESPYAATCTELPWLPESAPGSI